MPTWCIVRGCSNSSRKEHCKHLSWHSFPTQDERLLSEWLTRVGKTQVNKNWKICSEHFEHGSIEKTLTGRRRLKKGAVPTLFAQQGHKRKWITDESLATKQPKLQLGQKMDLTFDENQSGVSGDSTEVAKLKGLKKVIKELKQARIKSQVQGLSTNENILNVQPGSELHPHSSQTNPPLLQPDYLEILEKLKTENIELKTALQYEINNRLKIEEELKIENQRLSQRINELERCLDGETLQLQTVDIELNNEKEQRFQLEQDLKASYFTHKSLSKNPKMFHYYTGFNQEEFETFVNFLGITSCTHLSYRGIGESFWPDDGNNKPRKGRIRTLMPRDELLLVLCRVRLGFPGQDLAARFHTSQPQVSRIYTSLTTHIENRCKEAGIWPSQDSHNKKPLVIWESLKTIYPKVKMLMDVMKKYLHVQMPRKCTSMVV